MVTYALPAGAEARPGCGTGHGGVRLRDGRQAETSESVGWQNFGKMLLVFGCIGSDFCKKICVLLHFQNLPDSQTEIFEI